MAVQQFGDVAALPVAEMARILTAVDNAMQAEHISDATITRVRNRLVWGHPDGSDAVVRLTPTDLALLPPEDYERLRRDLLGGT